MRWAEEATEKRAGAAAAVDLDAELHVLAGLGARPAATGSEGEGDHVGRLPPYGHDPGPDLVADPGGPSCSR